MTKNHPTPAQRETLKAIRAAMEQRQPATLQALKEAARLRRVKLHMNFDPASDFHATEGAIIMYFDTRAIYATGPDIITFFREGAPAIHYKNSAGKIEYIRV